MAWYYQTTPRDSWDYDAVQALHFADLTINGEPRKVIMQANKNGFFYVLDRQSGKLLSAEKFAFTNWASHIDMNTGRPVLLPNSGLVCLAQDRLSGVVRCAHLEPGFL